MVETSIYYVSLKKIFNYELRMKNTNFEFHRITLDDIEKIAILFDEYRIFYGQNSDFETGKKFLKERIEKDESVLFAAREKNSENFLGYIQFFPSFSSVSLQRVWILNDLFVRKEARKKGVGSFLMKHAEEFARNNNAARILLCTAPDNKKAQKLYEEMGYEEHEMVYYFFPF